MRSAVAMTYEIDDIGEAARQLADTINKNLVLEKNSIGILLCDADMDASELTKQLKAILGMDIAGMTTLATLDTNGRHETAAVLTVLTADRCAFFPAVSKNLTHDNSEEAISASYAEVVKKASAYGERPGFMFVFCPYGMPFSGDRYPEILSKASGNVPLIGGVASDDYDYERARVFFSGDEYRDAMVLVSVWGEVKPTFAIRHVTSSFAERIRRIVDASGNVVRRVGNETLVEYLESFGLKTDVADPLLAFTSYPMMLTREDSADEVPIMRHILAIDHTTGSGTFVGDVPTGSLANICLIKKDDIKAACRDSLSALLQEAERTPNYTYSTIFCVSCCGRAMILGSDADAEGNILSEMLPEGIALTGVYCLGEICPVLYKDGEAVNRFHNCSITLCMF
ncbi:MAG: FIST C-terminal domain-containing protein [Syntrophomonadaceae bacterium]|jgi:hypothetical protein|nr:FIST C-terminal domain-containing protein [Syntrophomonadaceae bacterium]